MASVPVPTAQSRGVRMTTQAIDVIRYLLRHKKLASGLGMLVFLVLFWLIGSAFVNLANAQPLSAPTSLSPSLHYPFGTDVHGRDLFAAVIEGIPLTLRIGFIAGGVGLGIGICLGFVSGYFGGPIDSAIKFPVDVLLAVPAFAVLVVVAASIQGSISVDLMGLILASLAWMAPTRVIRSQVLTLRQRMFIRVSRLSGASHVQIMVREILPNMAPFLGATLVNAVTLSILASIGLAALGLGPQSDPTMGMIIYYAIQFAATINGMWWWWGPPVLVVMIVFVGLLLISAGLDEITNPRLRTTDE